MSLASDGRGEGALARLPRAYLLYESSICSIRVLSPAKVYSPRSISSAPLLPKECFSLLWRRVPRTNSGLHGVYFCSPVSRGTLVERLEIWR